MKIFLYLVIPLVTSRHYWTEKRARVLALKSKRLSAAPTFKPKTPPMLPNNNLNPIEKLLHQHGLLSIKPTEDVFSKSSRTVSLKSSFPARRITKEILSQPLYMSPENYEVPANSKLFRQWKKMNETWFPKVKYNRAYFLPSQRKDNIESFKKSAFPSVNLKSGWRSYTNKPKLVTVTADQAELYGIKSHKQQLTKFRFGWEDPPLNREEQDCLNTHNYFRSLHLTPGLTWSKSLAASANTWAEFLSENAPGGPDDVEGEDFKTREWPHSDRKNQKKKSKFDFPLERLDGVGETIAYDFSPYGTNCSEQVTKMYAQIFNFNPLDPLKPRVSASGGIINSVGHLTQLLWKNSTQVGCATAKAIPSIYDSGMFKRGMYSTYLVCHYKTLGNVVTEMLDNYQPLRSDICTTFDSLNGRNACVPEGVSYSRFIKPKVSGQCMGLNAEYNRCECHSDSSKVSLNLKFKYKD